MYLLTSNANKVKEYAALVPGIQQLNLGVDIPEIQSNNPEEIIRAKLQSAIDAMHSQGKEHYPLIVEDTCFEIACLNELPGPQIKWWLKAIGSQGIAELVLKYPQRLAVAATYIGVALGSKSFAGAGNAGVREIFFGATAGNVVSPRGSTTFGFDNIFQPHGHDKTYAEMTEAEKNAVSHRSKAIAEMKRALAGELLGLWPVHHPYF